MGVPIQYRRSTENTASSYDYFDIADGVGYTTLYGAFCQSSGAITSSGGILTKNKLYSDLTYFGKGFTGSVGVYQLLHDFDFDTTINKPTLIRGNMLVSICGVANDTGAGPTFYFVISLKKYSGTTETTIATGTSETWSYPAHANNLLVRVVVPLTKYAKNDILRLNVKMYGTRSAGSSQFFFSFDPAGRIPASIFTTGDSTALIVNLPLVIDI